MLARLRRLFAPPRTRALEAGARGRRWDGAPVVSRSLTNDVAAQGRTVSARASHAARNDPHAAAAVSALVASIVGPGIVPSSQHPDPEARERVNALWADWVSLADFDRLGDFYALQALAVRQMIEVGESFAHLFDVGDGLRLRLIHPDQVPFEFPLIGPASNVRAGVELDDLGRVVAYHVLPRRPDDPTAPFVAAYTPVRVPADDVAHLFQPLEPGQLRGLSWLAPVLLKLHDLDQHADAALMRAKVAALLCGVITDPDGSGAGLGGTQTGGTLTTGLEPGTLLSLPPGKGVEFLDPKESQHFDAFTKSHLRAVAAGLGIPYELLTGDLSGVNYSSIRAGMVEFRRKLEHWQHNVVVFRFCRPIWDRWIEYCGLSGLLPGYLDDPAPYHRVDWLPPRQEWVDPKKDTEAEVLAIRAGLKSRTQAITERGYSPEKVDAEIALDRAREQRLGLAFDTTLPTTAEAPADA
ncbi:phage portal protein [Pararhodospirillum oryzae]|uniref:phage portal protein n=1 Tax=Pararhodospirillum oryzae TaxID=478448 RepID=UPI001FEA242C|nr:phage portal protein [Pararhodospirillum oryzae]